MEEYKSTPPKCVWVFFGRAFSTLFIEWHSTQISLLYHNFNFLYVNLVPKDVSLDSQLIASKSYVGDRFPARQAKN